jgi:iron complex outermembrane receptor protein
MTMPNRKPLLASSALALLSMLMIGGNRAVAQTANPARTPDDERVVLPTFSVDASKDTGYIGSNSLSASRAAINVADMPSSVIVITRQLIDDIGAFDVADTLRFVSGVTDSSMPAQDTLAFKIRGTGATVSTDGFRVSGEGTRDLAEVERVEVLKGPSAILFARGGSAGATVNRITKKPLPVAQGYLKVQTGAFDANRVEFDSTGPVPKTKDKLLYRMILAVQDDDSYFDNVSTKRYVASPSLTYQFNKDTYATLKYNYFWNKQTQYVGVPIDLSDPTELRLEHKLYDIPRERTTSDPNESQFTRRHRVDFRSGTKVNSIFRTSLNAQYMETTYTRSSTRPNGTPIVQPDGSIPRRWAFSQQHDYRYRLYNDNIMQFDIGPVANTTVFGFDLLQEGPGQDGSSPNVTIPPANLYQPPSPVMPTPEPTFTYTPRSEQRNAQVYLMETLKTFKERLIFSGGITRNWVDIDSYSSAADTWGKQKTIADTKQYGVILRPIPWISAYYGYNENFDAQFVRLGAVQPDGSVIDAGVAPPRMSVANEFGVKFTRDDGRLSASVAHFDTDLTNRTRVIVGTPYQELQSGGNYTGWESDIFYRPTDNISIIATYSFTDATDTNGNQIEAVAPRTLSGLVRYDFRKGMLKGLGVSLAANYQSDYVLSNGPVNYSVESRTLIDAGLFYNWKDYKFQLNVNNLTDKKYIAGGFLPQRVFIGTPRNIRGTVTYTW